MRPAGDAAAEPGCAARPRFDFRDLASLRATLSLLERGVPLRRIRRTLDGLRTRMPELERPLLRLRLWGDRSGRVVLDHAGVLLEPDGQLVLDFRPDPCERVTPLQGVGDGAAGEPETALAWFERGCTLDAERRTQPAAIEAYRRALELDPGFADAHCNLGTLLYNLGRRDEAGACFREALELAPAHPEAHFNLANVLEEVGRDESALAHYKRALEADPFFADARLNLALLFDKLGLRRTAREHWRRYLQLEPQGGWAETARRRLEADEGGREGPEGAG